MLGLLAGSGPGLGFAPPLEGRHPHLRARRQEVRETEMPFPRVTIVTSSLNQGRFIAKALNSVLEQDYANLEHLVVDGGSTDGTAEILRDFARRSPDILRWVSEPDRGQTNAVNKGFRRAGGGRS